GLAEHSGHESRSLARPFRPLARWPEQHHLSGRLPATFPTSIGSIPFELGPGEIPTWLCQLRPPPPTPAPRRDEPARRLVSPRAKPNQAGATINGPRASGHR